MGMNLTMIKAIQGHIDSSFDDMRWAAAPGEPDRRRTSWFLGDDPDGPVVATTNYPPNPEEKENAPIHSYSSDTLRIILEGSFKVGERWYKAGEMRFQEAGVFYGPLMVGPEGCRQVLIWEKSSSMVPNYAAEEDASKRAAEIEGFAKRFAEMRQARAADLAAAGR